MHFGRYPWPRFLNYFRYFEKYMSRAVYVFVYRPFLTILNTRFSVYELSPELISAAYYINPYHINTNIEAFQISEVRP
jgi:hypothetical protein